MLVRLDATLFTLNKNYITKIKNKHTFHFSVGLERYGFGTSRSPWQLSSLRAALEILAILEPGVHPLTHMKLRDVIWHQAVQNWQWTSGIGWTALGLHLLFWFGGFSTIINYYLSQKQRFLLIKERSERFRLAENLRSSSNYLKCSPLAARHLDR